MNSEQLGQIMTGQIQQYQNLNANMQTGMMYLPVTAILMAVWMPQRAKENGIAAPP